LRNQLEAKEEQNLEFTGGRNSQDLIHGQLGNVAMNKRRKNSIKTLDTVSGDQPQNSISQLERRVAQLEEDVATLKRQAEWPRPAWDAPTNKKVKPGVKERIEGEALFKYRDGLIRWLEAYWPWMEDRLHRAKTAEEIRAILEAVSEEALLEAGLAEAVVTQSSTTL